MVRQNEIQKICGRIAQLRTQKGSSEHKTNFGSGHDHTHASESPVAIEELKKLNDDDLMLIISNIRRLTKD